MKKILIAFFLLCFSTFTAYSEEPLPWEEYMKTLAYQEYQIHKEAYNVLVSKCEFEHRCSVWGQRPLFKVIALNLSGRTPELQQALANITDPTERMLNHTFWAISSPDDVKTAIKMGANLEATAISDLFFGPFVDKAHNNDLRILDFALESCRPEMVDAVLEAMPNTDYANIYGVTPLMRAAYCHPADIVKRIIDMGGVETVNWEDFLNKTALNYAEFDVYPHFPNNASYQDTMRYILPYMTPTHKILSTTFWKYATAEDVRNEIINGADVNYSKFNENGKYNSFDFAVLYSSDYEAIGTLLNKKPSYLCEVKGYSFSLPVHNLQYRNKDDKEALLEFLKEHGVETGNLNSNDYYKCESEGDRWHVIPE